MLTFTTFITHSLVFIGLPKPLGVQIVDSETTNASLTLSWGYPPPPSDPIRNFFVSDLTSSVAPSLMLYILYVLFLLTADHLLR